ncbi:MAG: T9SS C-terminal target domain-containing protein, partial [Calditrichaeota bacterium]
DTASIVVKIDTVTYQGLGQYYDFATRRFSFVPSTPVGDGTHQLILLANSLSGSHGGDTTSFQVQADVVQILSRPAETHKTVWRIQGAFFRPDGGFDSTVTTAQLVRWDSTWTVQVENGLVDTTLHLLEGDNYFRLQGVVGGQLQVSDSVNFHRIVEHAPFAQIDIIPGNGMITLSAASSSDPDGQSLTYLWDEDPLNPEPLGIAGQTAVTLNVTQPAIPGEYFVELLVQDSDGERDSTRAFFVVRSDTPAVEVAGYADNPSWVKNARIYTLFFKAFTPQGTIQAAIPHLQYIRDMGFNVIWVLPVTDVEGDPDNSVNIGYNIIDFFNVDPAYGTNEDFRQFVQAAHQLGLKVILDITPNHTGREHPFAREAKQFREFSPYWNYYQTMFIPHNDNGLGQCTTPQGIYYYCGFSDALLNYNWMDLDAREYMIEVYEYWVREFGIDGFRFDVYWGPHRRYGEQYMGIPVRQAVKHYKPDVLLLGEDDGTGVGTEFIYADAGGGLDASYDFKLYFNAIRDFNFTSGAVNNLHNELYNGGFYPGENSYFMRFMESQDQDRIAYVYDSFVKTMPMATVIFTAPGTPMMYNGQEVGFGRGMGAPGEPDLNTRRRGVIDWNFAGKDLLRPHYHRLAHIRAQFPAFHQHKQDTNGDGQVNDQDESDFDRIATGDGRVYAFLRPYSDENGLTVVNFAANSRTVTLDLTSANLKFTGGFDPNATYWVNNLYSDTSYQVLGSDLASFSVTLEGYGSAVYVIATEQKQVVLPPVPIITGVAQDEHRLLPGRFALRPNYPNPFNPETTIEVVVPHRARVRLEVYNILGQRVRTLAEGVFPAGIHRLRWDGRNEAGQPVASGIYIVHLTAGKVSQSRRMVLLR